MSLEGVSSGYAVASGTLDARLSQPACRHVVVCQTREEELGSELKQPGSEHQLRDFEVLLHFLNPSILIYEKGNTSTYLSNL